MTQAPARPAAAPLWRRLPRRLRRHAREAVKWVRARSSVRLACDLGPDVPLMVYTGPLDHTGGLATALSALPRLPDLHLAVLCDPRDPVLAELRAPLPAKVRRRVHVIPRGVARPPGYLSSADLGLVGFARPAPPVLATADVLAEYVRAGLPVVAGNARALREYVAEHHLGETFVPGSPRSFITAVTKVRERDREESPAPSPVGAGGAPSWRPLGATPVRLGLGTANFAGQLSAFAEALTRARADVSAEVVMAKPPASFRYPADVHIDFPREHQLVVQLEQVRRVLGGYTHLIVDAFRPILGRLNGDDIAADLPALARAKIKVALLAHGSEIRHPKDHLARHECSGFADAPEGLVDKLTVVAEHNRRTAEESGLPLFVTTPDLLDDVPWATWAPLVVDVDDWACDRPPMQRPRPVVLHAPSARWTKGTDRILPVLDELHEKKIIEFRLVEGVPYSRMRELVTDADILVDQLVMGSYCTFGCEGMAAGKPVITYIGDSGHRAVGVTPPVAHATPATLRTAIESLLDDRDAAVRMGEDSVKYVREFHDGRRTALAFDAFLR